MRARAAAAALLLLPACHGGDAGTGGAGGAGGGPAAVTLCQPGVSRACYSGPLDVAGFGACRAGTETCRDDGSGYGPCEGEVLPEAPQCGAAEDTDCDGAPGCHGHALWARTITAQTVTGPSRAAIGADGSVAVGLGSTGVLRVGGAVVASSDGVAAMVVKLDAAGDPAWAARVDTSWMSSGVRVAMDGAGAVVAAWTQADDDLGGLPSIHLAKLDAAGATVWTQALSVFSEGSQPEVEIDADEQGRIAIMTSGNGTFAIGGAPLYPNYQIGDADRSVAAVLDPDGNRLWARGFTGHLIPSPVRAVEGGVVFTVIERNGMPFDLGGGLMDPFQGALARFDAAGDLVSSVTVPMVPTIGPAPVAAGPGGAALVAYPTAQPTPNNPPPAPGCDLTSAGIAFEVHDAAGTVTALSCLPALNVDALGSDADHFYALGSTQEDLGTGVPPAKRFTRFLAAFDAGGGLLWARRLYRADHDLPTFPQARDLAFHPLGGAAFAGPIPDGADFGTGPLVPALGSAAMAVARMSP